MMTFLRLAGRRDGSTAPLVVAAGLILTGHELTILHVIGMLLIVAVLIGVALTDAHRAPFLGYFVFRFIEGPRCAGGLAGATTGALGGP